tara:strand:- start:371 stop:739 length:369 start_codon:yes stop_codon:yes gene_type:complete
MINKLNAHKASLINAISLILIGGFGYLQSETPSPTALIPVVVGVLLIAMNKGVKDENKIIAHIAVLLTLIMLLGLAMPLMGSVKRGDTQGTIRVIVMIFTTIGALFYFVKSFIDARKSRESS